MKMERVPWFRPVAIYERVDWLSFAFAAAIALVVYGYTLSPGLTLEWSGMYATAANYGGIGPPPGFPGWCLYAWVFTKILPFGNIAWRIAVSSALAGAVCCGLVALLVSRGIPLVLGWREKMGTTQKPSLPAKRSTGGLSVEEQRAVRIVCGVVAALGFGFHNVFWGLCVIVDSTAFGIMLLLLSLTFLFRWALRPRVMWYLYLAAFAYGLSLTAELFLAAAAPALPIMIFFLRRKLGRDLIGLVTLFLSAILIDEEWHWMPEVFRGALQSQHGYRGTYQFLLGVYAAASAVAIVATRGLFTQVLRAVAVSVAALTGWSVYWIMPLVSMGNPPSNWGYPRTVEGFVHVLNRGQFEQADPSHIFSRPGIYADQIGQYFSAIPSQIAWPYCVAAVTGLYLLFKTRGRARTWLLALGVLFVAMSFFVVAMLNFPPDRQAWGMAITYFGPSYLILFIFGGVGMAWMANKVSAFVEERSQRAG